MTTRRSTNLNINEETTENVLNCQFDKQPKHHVIVSDLTYVRVENSWNYICVLIDFLIKKS